MNISTQRILIGLTLVLSLSSASCQKKKPLTTAEAENTQATTYEIFCGNAVYPPYNSTEQPPKLPDQLPMKLAPIAVQGCEAMDKGPQFFGGEMPGLVAMVDCTARIVRFRTRDWQANEASMIDPAGNVDLRTLFITRFKKDAMGNSNCWSRLTAHIMGHVQCGTKPNDARLTFKVDWAMDPTPPEAMEPAAPGVADLRNGTHCTFNPGNCLFSNQAEVGCGG